MVLLAFIGMSLAWSFSWFAMKLQVDSSVPLELSLFYRFFLTSFLMFALCLIAKQRLWLTKKEIPYLFFIGFTNFFANFLIGYHAVAYIPSGAIATVFSLSIIISEIISSMLEKRKMDQKVIISSIIGCVGLSLFIIPMVEFSEDGDVTKILTGFALALVMVIIYSVGNVMIARNKKANATPLYTSIAHGTLVGSVLLLVINLMMKHEFVFENSAAYIGSLAYLVIIASVIAFICLFYLIQKIGSAKANYTALVYPAIALITSAYFENFHFNVLGIIGFGMIIVAIGIEFVRKVK